MAYLYKSGIKLATTSGAVTFDSVLPFNYAFQQPFSIDTIPVSQYTAGLGINGRTYFNQGVTQDVFTLTNGYTLRFVWDGPNSTNTNFYWYDNNGVRVTEANPGFPSAPSALTEWMYYVGICSYDGYESANCFAIYNLDSSYKWIASAQRNVVPLGHTFDFILESIQPDYVWTAWGQIAGNNGQYRNNLTKIKQDSIGDISGANYGTDSDITRITQSSDVVPYVRNMNYNSPVKIAYSGVNWMTAEIQPDTGLLTNQVKCVFKFYIKNVSEATPFYSLTEYFFIGDADHHYLSFVHDDEQQAAAFLPVGFSKSTPQTPYYWGNVSPTESEMNLLWLWLQASGTPTPDPQPSGPYDNGTTDNGGTGGNPIPQDDIHTPNVPVLGAMSSGMFTVYCPNDTQLGQIAQYLWSDNFIDNVKKYFNNVSDNIIAFYVLPLEPESLPTKNFKIGNLENASITGVKYLNSRFISVDMGSVTVESRWDTYLDFSPFTRFNCYLPGVGIVALDSDDIMSPANQDGSLPTLTGSTISLEYVIDLFTGVLVAYVMINGQIRYQFPGRMGYSIPLTGQNYTAMGQGFVTAMAGLASTIATGGTAAPFTAGATAAGIVNAMKPDVYRGGNLSGDASMLSLKTPILIRTRPNKPAIEKQELFSGAPSYKIDTIGNFSGFTQVAEAHIEGVSCTDAERNEIMQLLRSGVLI